MKKHILLCIVMSAAIFYSCNNDSDSLFEEGPIESSNATFNPPESSCFITPAVLEGGPCANPQVNDQERTYTLYVSSGTNTVNYDRRVEIAVIHDNTFVDAALVTIPANQHISNHVSVFDTATENYGLVTLRVLSVRKSDGTLDSSCTLRSTSPAVNNCFTSNNGGGDIDFCNGNDADGDGICDDNDPTPDGDGFLN